MSQSLLEWEATIVGIGAFIVFLVTYVDYVLKKISPIIKSWFRK